MAKRRGIYEDPALRLKLAKLYSQSHSLRAMGYKGFASFAQGGFSAEHSLMKVAISELQQTLFELGMDLQNAGAALLDPDIAEEGARWQTSFFGVLAATIGGGTSEIQRNVIAQHVLQLPKGA